MRLALAAAVALLFVGPPASHADFICKRSSQTVIINLDNVRHRHILDHAWDAIAKGEPRILHIDRVDAFIHRRESLRGIPTKPGYDRDEYPPAVSLEGGYGADVRYVGSSENRSAGSVMMLQLRPWCEGQRFAYEHR